MIFRIENEPRTIYSLLGIISNQTTFYIGFDCLDVHSSLDVHSMGAIKSAIV